MEIDSLDPIPFSSTGAGTFVFALREIVVRLLRAIFVAGENNVPKELSSLRGRPSFFFGLPDFVAVVVFVFALVTFLVSFFAFVSFSFVRFLGMHVDTFALLEGGGAADCPLLVEVVAVVAIEFPS